MGKYHLMPLTVVELPESKRKRAEVYDDIILRHILEGKPLPYVVWIRRDKIVLVSEES